MLTKTQIAALRVKLDKALADFAAENGLTSGVGSIKYSDTSFEAKVTFTEKDANPNAVNPEFIVHLKRRGFFLGLTEAMIGTTVVLNGRRGLIKYTFQGMKNSKIVMKDGNAQNFLFSDEIAPKIVAAYKAA